MGLYLIVAMSRNKVIGKENSLPWFLPEDLKYVKEMTTGHSIVMGRKTFNSINNKPLPNRENIILTRDKGFEAEGCTIVHTKEDILEMSKNKKVFIFGGNEIYKLFEEDITVAYITYIDHPFEGDTYFPLDLDKYKEISRTKGLKDSKNPYDYYFIKLHRK